MEMEDHHQHHHHHNHNHNHDHQQQQYAITDLMHLIPGPRSLHFPSIPLPTPTEAELFPGHHRNLLPHHHHHQQQHYEMMMFGRDIMHPLCNNNNNIHDFVASTDSVAPPTATTTAATTSASTPPLSGGLEVETGCCIGGDASTGRWPRQETLTLLDIRSQLHPKFKEANSKGPLWDEVSRIMYEEHGYQRSGKKCKEKFENLYKYYKKTKEGKAGRQDGKHYRFFRQLEALYGENINNFSVAETNFGSNIRLEKSSINTQSQTNLQNFSLGLTNSTDFDTSLTDNDGNDHNNDSIDGLMEINNNGSMLEKRKNERKSRKCWKLKIKDFIDSQIRKLVEKQEEWLEKLVKTMEQREKERVLREEEWRKQEVNRLEREHKFWAKERAWIEARDAALMEALQKLSGGEIKGSGAHHEGVEVVAVEKRIINSENQSGDGSKILNSSIKVGNNNWQESEITRLQELRNGVETWEEVANKMACYGYERTALMCKEKWESIIISNNNNVKVGNKKRKENSSCFYFENNNDQSSLYNQGNSNAYCDINDQRVQTKDGSSPSNSKVGHADPCFPFLMNEGGNLWENYGLKINKENQNL